MIRTKHRWLAALAGGAALAATVLAPASAAQSEHPDTETILSQYHQKAGPGATVYAGHGDESWTVARGSLSLAGGGPITPGHHFRNGSQTKTFTAAAVLQLVEEGSVELDAPIERYLPGVVTGNYDGNVITVRQLLQHTSGMVRDVSDAEASPDGTYELAELVRSAMDEPPQAAPGESFNYSNVAYLILGMLLEEITGQYVGDVITERIIEPLGLTGTSFPAPGERALSDPYVPGYQGFRVFGVFFGTEMTTGVALSVHSPAGAMQSTLEDMVTFHRALAGGEVVSEASLSEMRTTVAVGETWPPHYGLGLIKKPLSCGGVAWGHSGSLPTGHTSATLVTDDGRFASIVTNSFVHAQNPAHADVLDIALCEA